MKHRELTLSKGKVALVDDCDYEKVSAFKWCATKNGTKWYAKRRSKSGETIYLHRFIFGKKVPLVDHKNRDGLDCRRDNLRMSSKKLNAANADFPKDKRSSRYRGVSLCKTMVPYGREWEACIKVNQEKIGLGYFAEEDQAALAYNMAALKYFGESARLNLIGENCAI